MRVFIELFKLNLKVLIQYKKTFLFTILAEPVVFLTTIVSLNAVYECSGKNTVVGFEFNQMAWYYAGISLVWMCIWNAADGNISRKVISGDLSVDLLKPVSVFNAELANAIGSRLISFVVEFIPCAVVFSLMVPPSSITMFAMMKFIVLLSGAFMIYFLLNYLIGITSFYIKSNYSLQSLRVSLIAFTSGAMIPFEFYPHWLKEIVSVLPFQYIFYRPILILVNMHGDGNSAASFREVFLMQIFWMLILYFVGVFFWNRAIRKYCASGG